MTSAADAEPRPGATTEGAFDTPAILTVSGGHLVHDMYPAFIGVLLSLLIPKLGIRLAMADSARGRCS